LCYNNAQYYRKLSANRYGDSADQNGLAQGQFIANSNTNFRAPMAIPPFQIQNGQDNVKPKPVPMTSVSFSPSGVQNGQAKVDFLPVQTMNNMISVKQEEVCGPNTCLNEGVCVVKSTSDFECKCPWGWSGKRCEICLTECASNPCPSNKKCKAKYLGGYECVCPADKVGLDCEIQNDLCASEPCLNGGVCKPVEGGTFTCVCDKPWSGDNCERIWENPCTEEVLRSNQILQFKDAWDRNSYLICTDLNIYHTMPCSTGTYFNEKLRHCVPEGYDPPSCPDQHCKNDADCIIDEGNNLRCVCKK